MRRPTIDGIIELTPRKFADDRGYFAEVYNKRGCKELGILAEFVQDNESLSVQGGTVRGLHFQIHPSVQGKLVRCQQGALLDVVVDIRHGSPTFGDHVVIRLDPETGTQLWVPPGFAHGFCTLEPNTVIAYKVTSYYDAAADRGIRWDDADLGIAWPVNADEAILSSKDETAPTLAQFGSTAGLF